MSAAAPRPAATTVASGPPRPTGDFSALPAPRESIRVSHHGQLDAWSRTDRLHLGHLTNSTPRPLAACSGHAALQLFVQESIVASMRAKRARRAGRVHSTRGFAKVP